MLGKKKKKKKSLLLTPLSGALVQSITRPGSQASRPRLRITTRHPSGKFICWNLLEWDSDALTKNPNRPIYQAPQLSMRKFYSQRQRPLLRAKTA